ncbi:hypothetical protein [Thomasclavelia sp.]|uniref:hypothetical protein n=1 Tax=Thomasclavelia sp. TaxID=3025757 RepID=UPI0025D2F83E|nr:hypothetical protein [Thomasclavelia sp.]
MIIININYFINIFLLYYFFKPVKRISLSQFIRTILAALLITITVSTIFVSNIFLKNIFVIIIYLITNKFIYHVKTKKSLVNYLIFFTLNLFVELIIPPLFSNHLNNGIFHMTTKSQIMMALSCNFLLIFLLKAHHYFTNQISIFDKKIFPTFILILMTVMISAILGTFLSIKILSYQEHIYIGVIYLYILLFIIWICLLLLLIYKLIDQYKKTKAEALIQETSEYYQKILALSSLENNHDYDRLKHDILNYIQTYQTIDKKR